jgi:hypothetical protein
VLDVACDASTDPALRADLSFHISPSITSRVR